jgi:hypothetical protein
VAAYSSLNRAELGEVAQKVLADLLPTTRVITRS